MRIKIVLFKIINPFPSDDISDWPKLKKFTDDNFKFDYNGVIFSKRVENAVGKGEIARHEQFLLFPQCFRKEFYCMYTRKIQGLFGKGLRRRNSVIVRSFGPNNNRAE